MKRALLPSLLLALLAFAPPVMRAQDAAPAPAPKAQPALISIEFPGGTLAQLVALVAKTPGGSFNVIGDPADLAIPLPAFTLQNIHPDQLARSLNNFLAGRGVTLSSTGFNYPGSRDVYSVQRTDKRPRPTVPPQDAFESIQLAPYLDQQKIDDIVGAIRAAWEMDPTHEASVLRLKFHPPTTILLVSGPPEATMLAAKVISAMKRTPHDYDGGGRLKSDANPKPSPEKR